MQMPEWWIVVSGLFFVVNTLVFVVIIFLLLKVMKIIDDLHPKVESLTNKVEILTDKVGHVAEKVEMIADSVHMTVNEVGGKTRSIVSTAERFTGSAGASLERFAPAITGLFTVLKFFKAYRDAKGHHDKSRGK